MLIPPSENETVLSVPQAAAELNGAMLAMLEADDFPLSLDRHQCAAQATVAIVRMIDATLKAYGVVCEIPTDEKEGAP